MKTTATRYFLSAVLLLPFFSLVQASSAQDAGRQARMAAVQSVERMLMDASTSLDEFIETKLAESYRTSMSNDALITHLTDMRKTVAGAGGLDIARANDDIHLIFSEGANATVVVRLAPDNSGISYLGLMAPKSPDQMTADELVDAARRTRLRAIESIGTLTTDAQLDSFVKEHFVEQYSAIQPGGRLLDQLRELRGIIASAGGIMVTGAASGTRVRFRGPANADVIFRLADEPPYLISSMDIDTHPDLSEEEANRVKVAPISWENVEERLAEEEEAGFSGAVLIVRDGKVVLHQGYGAADQETGREVTTETIFGIGSIPIDFTRAAILKLVDLGKLKLTDTIDQFYPDVPADKAGISINHLMTGRSGLPNFHHIPGTDENYDLSWIDRAEAERRMFAQPLLFSPGEGQSHSHSAFVLLSAIIERVSNHSYAEFLQRTFFHPIGMERTGFYGEDSGFTDDQMAVGYGGERVGPKNNALHWGPTSWLMMGSGGMVSTPGDMYKWLRAMYSGEYISQQLVEKYRLGGILAGGSDRGFLFMYADDPDNTVIFTSNAHVGDGDHASAIARALMKMAKPEM